ncbi:MAG: hypothetical protein ISF22_07610 [Methanomassiliicoccus sp.]|nr:hypothetical protein [Methanomassiliicoccus sp.]
MSVDKQDVVTGQQLMATVGVMNNGTADGDYEVRLFLEGVQVNFTTVSLGVGNSTTVKLGVTSNVAGTPTIRVDQNTTTFNCHERFVVGDMMKWHLTGYDADFDETIDAFMTTKVIIANSTSFTMQETYDGIGLINSTTVHSYDEIWSTGLANLTLVGKEQVSTAFGTKALSHYTYTYDVGPYQFNYSLFIDPVTEVRFKIATSYTTNNGLSTLNFDLVETNKVWVAGI